MEFPDWVQVKVKTIYTFEDIDLRESHKVTYKTE